MCAASIRGYQEKHFDVADKRVVPASDRRARIRGRGGGSLTIHQDARVYAALLDGEETVTHALAAGRRAYVHVAARRAGGERAKARGR